MEDFLKSQLNQSAIASGTAHNKQVSSSNVQSGQLLNSFLSTYNKMKGTGTGGLAAGLSAVKDSKMIVIKEEESNGNADELKKRQ